MPIHRSITFKVPYDLEKVYEVVSRPKEFFSILPISAELRSFRGSDVVMYLSAFGLKSDAVFSFVASKGANRVVVESSLIGELIMGFFRPPRMDLSFRLFATRVGEETEIAFELYIKAGAFRERISGLAGEVEKFISSIPESMTEALRRATARPVVEVKREEAIVPTPPTTPVTAVSEIRVAAPAELVERREEKREPEPIPAVPTPPVESTKPVGRVVSDAYLSILEDPVTIYRLTTGGKSIATLRMKYSSTLLNTLSNMSTKNGTPIYVVLRSEKRLARLIMIENEILGIVVEYENEIIKGDKALELLEKSEEEFICAVFAVSRELLDSLKRS